MKRRIIILCAIISIIIYTFISHAETEPRFKLQDPGTERIVDYEKYGTFNNIGTFDYSYQIKDAEGLAKASGEGIYPNTDVELNPEYKRLVGEGKLSGDPWSYVGSDDPQAAFYVWSTQTKLDKGLGMYFAGRALEAAGLYEHALKAYRAAMIFFPDSFCWNKSHLWTWLVAPVAWDAIINLTRMHPELELKLVDADIKTEIYIDRDPEKNKVAVTPGRFIKYTLRDREKARSDISKLKVMERRGGKVACVKYSNGQWGLEVEGKPFIVRGIYYAPTKIGSHYAFNWMSHDGNRNGLNDAAYESWVDKNKNDDRDPDEPAVGDFELLRDMGCNTIRIMNTLEINKELLRDLYKKYGIRVLICDPFGAYTVHSMASWNEGTDYTHPDQRSLMKEAALNTVMECKDEDWLLCYVLGNENNMPADYTGVNATRTKASIQPKEYAEFLNEVAEEMHKLDPNHPVGVGNLELWSADYYAKYAPALDFIGANAYPGAQGFGSLWIRAKNTFDRPVLITEYGCDAYWTSRGIDEDAQESYHKNAWEDIMYNTAGEPGAGNSIGGVIFEWLDEWWKAPNDPYDRQNRSPTVDMAFPDGWSQEEFLGIAGQGDGRYSPLLRDLRKSYYMYKRLWRES
ncbi:MAG: hypothetical protein KBB52_05490 [Candidatus Omnitrophica bacterium]|nr:hypothetical protein [Candidatus Omnitrophota bacterium]